MIEPHALLLRMRGRLGKTVLSFSFQRSNKVGSDERISQKLASTTDLASLTNSLDLLREELATKERIIRQLCSQLQQFGAIKHQNQYRGQDQNQSQYRNGYSPIQRQDLHSRLNQHRSRPSLRQRIVRMARSASIKSLGIFFGKVGPSNNSNSNSNSYSTEFNESAPIPRQCSRLHSLFRRRSSPLELTTTATAIATTASPSQPIIGPRMSFEALTSNDAIKEQNVDINRLEEYLDEESLLENLAICHDFLVFMEPGELDDRKYRAMLTGPQFKRLYSHG